MLEDGSVYEGTARGDFKETACEIVFNTSMTGYVEILTDPSYAGQGSCYDLSHDRQLRYKPRGF